MAMVTLKGTPCRLAGELPTVGRIAPPFCLTGADLSDVRLDHFLGQVKLLNIVPSLDTAICATSTRRFHEALRQLPAVTLLNISADLPFAQARFCSASGLDRIVSLSTFRSLSFGEDYGVRILDGPLKGLMARAVLVLGRDHRVLYTQLVPEITQEPDYETSLNAARSAADG